MPTLMFSLKFDPVRFCRSVCQSLIPRTSQSCFCDSESFVDRSADRSDRRVFTGVGRRFCTLVWTVLLFLPSLLVLHGTSWAAPPDLSDSHDILAQLQAGVTYPPVLIAQTQSRQSTKQGRSRVSGRSHATSDSISPSARKKRSQYGMNRSVKDRRPHADRRRYTTAPRERRHETRVTPSILKIPDGE